jgi:hypothetical protein
VPCKRIASNIGGYVQIYLKQGKPFRCLVRMKVKSTGLPYPLAGKAARCVIKRTGLSSTVVANVTATVSIPDSGIWLTMTRQQTAAIRCGESIEDELSQYKLDCELVDTATGNADAIIYADVGVFRDLIGAP